MEGDFILRWNNSDGRAIVIRLENLHDETLSLKLDNSIRELQACTTWLLFNSTPDLPLCFSRERINDPRSHSWRGIAADIINAVAFYSMRRAEVLGYSEDNITTSGLSCLGLALSLLCKVHRVFSEFRNNPNSFSSSYPVFCRVVGCNDISQLKPRLEKFLQAMEEVAMHPPYEEELANHLTNFYGVLILFLIRCTLRSVFQYLELGFQAAENQKTQDSTFVMGSACPIYQLNLTALRTSNITIAETWPSDELKNRKTLWLYAQCQRARKLLAMPDGMNRTLGQHLEYSIDLWLDL